MRRTKPEALRLLGLELVDQGGVLLIEFLDLGGGERRRVGDGDGGGGGGRALGVDEHVCAIRLSISIAPRREE